MGEKKNEKSPIKDHHNKSLGKNKFINDRVSSKNGLRSKTTGFNYSKHLGRKIIVQAPLSSEPNLVSSIVSVELFEHENVRWLWSHTADGISVVTGYEITQQVTILDLDSDV